MRTLELHQVDAFTDQLFGGNPAGVVTNADLLTETEMVQIAREMNLSETAFVLPATTPGADVQLRFFTPNASEIDFCGHATVGALSQLARLGMFASGSTSQKPIVVQTKAETLTMSVANTETVTQVTFTAPAVKMEPYPDQSEVIARRLGIPLPVIKADATVLIDRKLRYMYIPVAALDTLDEQQFNFDQLRREFAAENIIVFCLFANDAQPNTLRARGLAPLVGVDEDPFTGSMQAGLVHAAKANAMIPHDQTEVRTTQGHSVGRPGQATIKHDQTSNAITVSAAAKQVFSTTMELI